MLVMNFFIVILALVGTKTLCTVNAKQYYFENIKIEKVEVPPNDVLVIKEDFGGSKETHFMRQIKKLLINATVLFKDDDEKMYTGTLVNVCGKPAADSWEGLVVKLFKGIVLPPKRKRTPLCPIRPGTSGRIDPAYPEYVGSVSDELKAGKYEVSYSAQTAIDHVILSSLKLTMTV